MFSANPCDKHYNTVRRVTRILSDAGYDVRVIARLRNDVEEYEESDGATISRVAVDPVNSRILRLLRTPYGRTRRAAIMPLEKLFPGSFAALRNDLASREARRKLVTHWPGIIYTFARRAVRENPRRLLLLALAVPVYVIIGLPCLGATRLPSIVASRCLGGRNTTRYCTYLDYSYRALRVARKGSAEVYHAHNLPALPVAWFCARLRGAKLVYDAHELWLDVPRVPPRSRLNRFVVQGLESFLIRRSDATIMAGLSGARLLSERYGIPTPTVVLNAPFYQEYTPSTVLRDALGIPKRERVLLCMGLVTRHRGIEQAVRSLKYLNDVSLVVLGTGPEEYLSALRQLTVEEGQARRVHFFGRVPFDDLTRYAMSADVGLVLNQNASQNMYYVSPNRLFESIAAGLPIVASSFPDLRFFVEGCNVGVTCDPGDPEAVAQAVNTILSDEGRHSEMRRNALEAAKVFNWENESKKIVALYDELVRTFGSQVAR